MNAGPTSVFDVIELKGFDDDEEQQEQPATEKSIFFLILLRGWGYVGGL